MNAAQDLMLKCIAAAGRLNEYDGERIAADLRKNQDKWLAAMTGADGIWLRDVNEGLWHSDMTVHIACTPEQREALTKLAQAWNADESDWLSEEDSRDFLRCWNKEITVPQILKLWWD